MRWKMYVNQKLGQLTHNESFEMETKVSTISKFSSHPQIETFRRLSMSTQCL